MLKDAEQVTKISAVSRKLVHSRTPLYLTEHTTYRGVECRFQLVDRYVSVKYT